MSFTPLNTLKSHLNAIDAQGLRRVRRSVESECQPHLVVDGKPMLAFNSNDYLGLAAHPLVIEALKEGASLYGAGSGASHLISGHSQAHERLEELLGSMLSPYLPNNSSGFGMSFGGMCGMYPTIAGSCASLPSRKKPNTQVPGYTPKGVVPRPFLAAEVMSWIG